jgi:hypothetical protein
MKVKEVKSEEGSGLGGCMYAYLLSLTHTHTPMVNPANHGRVFLNSSENARPGGDL